MNPTTTAPVTRTGLEAQEARMSLRPSSAPVVCSCGAHAAHEGHAHDDRRGSLCPLATATGYRPEIVDHRPGCAEADVRAFALQFPTANVAAALAHCESGRLSWEAVRDLFARSLEAGLAEVTA